MISVIRELTFISKTDAISRQHTRERMQQHLLDTQQLSQCTGVLATRSAVTTEDRLAQIVALLNRDASDGFSHAVQCELQSSFSHLLWRATHGGGQVKKTFVNDDRIKRLIAFWPE